MLKPIVISETRPWTQTGTGKQMFSFNQGAFHLSYAQLESAGVLNPMLLQGTIMQVEFWQKGEILLNGQEVRDDNVIVKSFIPEIDREVEIAVALDMAKTRASGWAARAQTAASVRRAQLVQQLNTPDLDDASRKAIQDQLAAYQSQGGAPRTTAPQGDPARAGSSKTSAEKQVGELNP